MLCAISPVTTCSNTLPWNLAVQLQPADILCSGKVCPGSPFDFMAWEFTHQAVCTVWQLTLRSSTKQHLPPAALAAAAGSRAGDSSRQPSVERLFPHRHVVRLCVTKFMRV